jgi:hypothetical protein
VVFLPGISHFNSLWGILTIIALSLIIYTWHLVVKLHHGALQQPPPRASRIPLLLESSIAGGIWYDSLFDAYMEMAIKEELGRYGISTGSQTLLRSLKDLDNYYGSNMSEMRRRLHIALQQIAGYYRARASDL